MKVTIRDDLIEEIGKYIQKPIDQFVQDLLENYINGKKGILCLTDKCGQPARWKGLCQKCYSQAKSLIESNQTNWSELELLGMIDAKNRVFINEFRKKKKENERTNPGSIGLGD